jgi:Family of unknown function (DUF5995)
MTTAIDFELLQQRLMAVAKRLDGYRWRYEQAKDSRCVFTYAYVLLTERIARELPGAGYLEPAWVVELAETFVERYFEALDASAEGRSVSPAWDAVFQAIDRKRSSVLEDLVFGITVHIVHDLPLGLRQVGLDGTRGSHVHDFHALNTAMGEEVDEITRCIARRYAPYIAWLDRLGHDYEDVLTSYGIRMARGMAWYNAIRLGDPASEPDAQKSIERSPGAFIETVLNPPLPSLRTVLRLCRFVVGLLRHWPKRNIPPPSLSVR